MHSRNIAAAAIALAALASGAMLAQDKGDRADARLRASRLVAWRGAYRSELLPFRRTSRALQRIAQNIDKVQEVLGRSIAIGNRAHYLRFDAMNGMRSKFLQALARRTGCGLLLDLNNV